MTKLMKYVRVFFSDGKMFDIPITVIAIDRANYCARHETTDSARANIYTVEYEFVMSDYNIAIEWCEGNMNWEDLEKYAIECPLSRKPSTYEDEWCNAQKDFIER